MLTSVPNSGHYESEKQRVLAKPKTTIIITAVRSLLRCVTALQLQLISGSPHRGKYAACLYRSPRVIHLLNPQHYLCIELDMLSKQESIKGSLLPVTCQAGSIESTRRASLILLSANEHRPCWTRDREFTTERRESSGGVTGGSKASPGGDVILSVPVIS